MIKTKEEIQQSRILVGTLARSGGAAFTMCIPPNQKTDSDFVLFSLIDSHEELREQTERDAKEITELKAELTESYRAFHWLFRALRRVSRGLQSLGEHERQQDIMAQDHGILEPDTHGYTSAMLSRLQSYLLPPIREPKGFREYVTNHPQAQTDREEMRRIVENDTVNECNYRYERDVALIDATFEHVAELGSAVMKGARTFTLLSNAEIIARVDER